MESRGRSGDCNEVVAGGREGKGPGAINSNVGTSENVPLNMFSWQGLSFVASPVGSPVRLHPETAQCLNLAVAKTFVKADLTKDLPSKMNFNIQGQDILVEYTYPWLPSKCLTCGKWGHTVCPTNREKQGEVPEVQKDVEVQGRKESVGMEGKATEVEKQNLENILKMAEKLNESSEEGNETVESQTEEEQGDKSLVQENVQDQVVVGVDEAKVLENVLSDTVSETAVVLQEDIKDQGENKWLDVSPAKASRSSATRSKVLDVAQDSLLTNSRFSVLSAEEEGEITDREGENSDLHTEDVKTSEGVEIKEKEATAQRQSLPRDSKLKHKYLGDMSVQKTQDLGPGELNKKKNRRHQ